VTPPGASAAPVRAGGAAAPAPLRLPPAPRRVSGPNRHPRAGVARPHVGSSLLLRLIDHPWLDRLVRGRTWIAIVAAALLGIVGMQVALLRLGAQIGNETATVNALIQQNETTRGTIGALEASSRVSREASALGMLYPQPAAVTYLWADAADVRLAAHRMGAPSAAAVAAAAARPLSTAVPAITPAASTTVSTATPAGTTPATTTPATTTPAGTTTPTGTTPAGTTPTGATPAGTTPTTTTPVTTTPSTPAAGTTTPTTNTPAGTTPTTTTLAGTTPTTTTPATTTPAGTTPPATTTTSAAGAP
jgi:hypothetical protein